MSRILSSRDLIRRLEADGWVLDHVSGNHHIFRHPAKRGPIVVPHPRRSLKRGTRRAIPKQAGLPS
ncbi:MAG TPA: type II toxin-antitoxin system HicA family toxin [Dongiaceae bacterium]|nr:type II toxin-antitoxin system HicA family toxin [Dongiaceae bacterium]